MCRKLSPDFPFQGHSNKTYQTFGKVIRENFRRDISQQDWSCVCDVLCAEWEAKFFTTVNSHALIKPKRIKPSRKVPWIISDLRKGMRDRYIAKRKPVKSLLSLTILKTRICTKGYLIRLMEMLNLVLKYPITVPMHFFSLMATHVKPGK